MADIETAKERLRELLAKALGRDPRDRTLVGTVTPGEVADLLAYVEALERECKAWRAFVPDFAEQRPAWTDKILEVAAARAATDALKAQ